jgi:hypothetical protein
MQKDKASFDKMEHAQNYWTFLYTETLEHILDCVILLLLWAQKLSRKALLKEVSSAKKLPCSVTLQNGQSGQV